MNLSRRDVVVDVYFKHTFMTNACRLYSIIHTIITVSHKLNISMAFLYIAVLLIRHEYQIANILDFLLTIAALSNAQ